MDLAPFIRELILVNECIILRGVGGFETSYKHATLDKKQKLFLPPTKKIKFREELIQDNGILENYLADNLQIKSEAASTLIDEYVEDFYNRIREGGKFIIEGVGEFSLGNSQKLVFNELPDENYLGDSFGLDILDISSEDQIPEKRESIGLIPVEQPKRKLTGWYIAIGILLLMVGISFIILLSSGGDFRIFDFSKTEKATDQKIVFGNDSRVNEDSVIRAIEKGIEERTRAKQALAPDQVENLSSDERRTTLSEKPDVPITYYLVAGSFKTRRNAEVLRDQLHEQGFSAEIISFEQNVRVIVGQYSNRTDAIQELRRLRQQLDKSIWLLEK